MILINLAYAFLTTKVTKIIYDNFGIPGLIIYKKQEEQYQELAQRLSIFDLEDKSPEKFDIEKEIKQMTELNLKH